ncbi:MAG TPA: MarR family winged helix-turn-helix transcriptional regulator [Candidatus Dormibacteraeota bacterium]|nr:MarR family winged helix-turn-helix transcriptional regulator [Candidatus Dormibacteraeota bacterium]
MRMDSSVRSEVAAGGPALFRLVRFWSRRWAADPRRGLSGNVAHVLILEAIDTAAADGPAAIAKVAAELGLDRSNASRMLADAVSAGLVAKTVAAGDARRAELAITAGGRTLLASARAWQGDMFARLVQDWPAEDARRFAGYLRRLASQPPPLDEGDQR